MTELINISDNIAVFKSENVKVFPCSFRGSYRDENGLQVYDPEARLNTEKNIIQLNALGNKNNTYIKSWEHNTLKCVIAGYSFTFLNFSINELADSESVPEAQKTAFKLYLNLSNNIQIYKDTTTTVIAPWNFDTIATEQDNDILDTLHNNIHIFKGIKVMQASNDGIEFDPAVYLNGELVINKKLLLTEPTHGAHDNTILVGNNLVSGAANQVVIGNYNKSADTESGDIIIGNGVAGLNSEHNAIVITDTYTGHYGEMTIDVTTKIPSLKDDTKNLATYITNEGVITSDDFTSTSETSALGGTTLSFVDTLETGSNGKITKNTKKTVTFGSTDQGVLKLNTATVDLKLKTTDDVTFNTVNTHKTTITNSSTLVDPTIELTKNSTTASITFDGTAIKFNFN